MGFLEGQSRPNSTISNPSKIYVYIYILESEPDTESTLQIIFNNILELIKNWFADLKLSPSIEMNINYKCSHMTMFCDFHILEICLK